MPVNVKAQETRPVLRIFISSTAVDLLDYREKVRDAVLRLEGLPIAMETFSASGQPADECMRMAAEADAVVCIVAHRYGYVPPKDLGGDGERSITWLEVGAAKKAGKPVFAFLVDPHAKWTEVKEQDRLTSEPTEKTPEIVKAVRKLQEFKAYLERECTRNTFSNDEELAKLVAITVAKLVPRPGLTPASTARIWKPLFCHALQPAQHFRGRGTKLQDLKDWLRSPVTADRVVSVVAAGGTGKTALVEKALRETLFSDRAGVFVWSFYEDPDTDKFLRAAYLYFTGERDTPTGGMLERLQMALSDDAPHILILDGLERVQSEGDYRRRGELEDQQLKRLVKGLAGGKGNSRALVTSRFLMVDLDAWTGAGHRAILLDDLERAVAFDVLRAWEVKGDDAALERLLEPLEINGSYHALSVAVLGSYLGNFAGGDPSRAPEFALDDAQDSDPKARKLSRILEQYAKALTQLERDLLARLSLFPRGVKIEFLGWIVQAGGDVAGALIGLADQQLVRHLERLKALGLVFRYETDRQVVYSAHPFLREFFRDLLRIKPEAVHESVRAKLAPNLDARPEAYPSDQVVLDQYQFLTEETLLAGRIQEAFDVYWYGLGNIRNLYKILGENVRGLRILERFVPQDDFHRIKAHLSESEQFALVNDLGIFAGSVGDLARSRRAYDYSRQLAAAVHDRSLEAIAVQSLCLVELEAARFPEALRYAENAVELTLVAKTKAKNSFVLRATTRFALGYTSEISTDFERATELEGEPLYGLRGIQEAECKFLCGDRSGARSQTEGNREFALRDTYNEDLCRCNAFLARLLATENLESAREYLEEALSFAERSGVVELQLRCFHASCELHLHLGNFPQAITEAEAGILLADTCGLGKYSVDLRLAFAETLLAAGEARKALQNARWALDRSEEPDCQYAWGKADGLHFCGVAHLRLGERELARQRLTAALELRERLGHGRIEETRRALELCQ